MVYFMTGGFRCRVPPPKVPPAADKLTASALASSARLDQRVDEFMPDVPWRAITCRGVPWHDVARTTARRKAINMKIEEYKRAGLLHCWDT